jgi:hypothetical protein
MVSFWKWQGYTRIVLEFTTTNKQFFVMGLLQWTSPPTPNFTKLPIAQALLIMKMICHFPWVTK